jgi:hypothetical protein
MDWTQLDTKSIHCVGWIQARNRAVESTLFRLGSKRKTKYVSRQQHVNLLGFLKKYQYWYVAPRYPHLCCSCNATMPIDLQGWCSGRRGILNGNGVIPTVARPLDHHWTIIGPSLDHHWTRFHRFQWRNLHALEFFHHTSDMFGDCTSVNQWTFDAYYSRIPFAIVSCYSTNYLALGCT